MGMEINNQIGFRAVNFKANQLGATTLKPSFKANEADSFVNSQEKEEGFISQHWGKILIGLAALATGAYFIFKGKGGKVKEVVEEATSELTNTLETAKDLTTNTQRNQKSAWINLHGDSSRKYIKKMQTRTSDKVHNRKQSSYDKMDWEQPIKTRDEVAAIIKQRTGTDI